jgi:hypothetical protein
MGIWQHIPIHQEWLISAALIEANGEDGDIYSI